MQEVGVDLMSDESRHGALYCDGLTISSAWVYWGLKLGHRGWEKQ